MSNWVRVNINDSTETNAFIDLEAFPYIKALFSSVDDAWLIQALDLQGNNFFLQGSYATETEACNALKNLLHGYEIIG